MKINTSTGHFKPKSDLNVFLNIMKTCLVLLFAFTLQLRATNVDAQNAIIVLESNTVTVSQLISEIEKQTDYLVVYSNSEINTSRTVNLKNRSGKVSEYLSQTFEGTDVNYGFEDKYIILSKKMIEAASTASSSVQTPQQQGKTVRGTIIDPNGEPVIGASIVVRDNPSQGTITDMDGNFTLSNVPEDAVLNITYVGMQSQSISVQGRTTINVTLHEDTEMLDELVVIGYGTMRKGDLTTAISTVSAEEIQSSRVTQLQEALQGTVAGLTVTRGGSTPEGKISDLYIRGTTTLSTNYPLILIDGVPGNMNDVHPNDVESMSVLKDAASASIYGSRAAAGVILITTKRAKQNDLLIDYSYQLNIRKPVHLGEYMDVQEYLKLGNEMNYNSNPEGGWYQLYTKDQVDNWVTNNKTDPDRYPIVDLKKLLLRDHATGQRHAVNMSAGAKYVRSNFSFTYDNNNAIIKNKVNYERYMLRTNNDIKINDWLSAAVDLNFSHDIKMDPKDVSGYLGGIAGYVDYYGWDYTWPVIWTDGRYAEGKAGDNPYAANTNPSFSKYQNHNLKGKFSLIITPFEGLKITANFAPDYRWEKVKHYTEATYWTYLENPDMIGGYFATMDQTNLTEIRNDSYDKTKQIFANYDKKFGDHSLSAIIGYEDRHELSEWFNGDRSDNPIKGYPYISMWPDTYDNVHGGIGVNYAYNSWFGRVSYNYNNKYLFQANVRRDGSSRFHKDYRWGTFPSVSAGWVLSEESFMQGDIKDWLSFLKLRVSYGELGNERIGNYFPYQSQIRLGKMLLHDGSKANSYQCSYPAQYVIDDISWETTKSTNIGIDTRFLDNRLNFTFDWYRKETTGMLLALQIPRYLGYSNPNVNAGDMHTKGWDVELGWRDKVGDFSYQVAANLSDYTSRMGDLKGTQFLGSKVIMEGSEYREWYGYLTDGLFLTQADLESSAKLNNRVGLGSVKFKDVSGPDGKPDGVISPEYDKVLLGTSSPHYQFGVNFLANYKQWDFNVMFQGIGKWNKMRSSRISEAGSSTMYGDWCKKGKYWSVLNTDEENARAIYPRLADEGGGYGETSDYWLMNGGYFRLKNLTVGYTLPQSLTKTLTIESLRLFVTGTDLLTFSNYPKEADPEASSYAQPLLQNYIFGLSVKF
jgi:TonB-linked SusC/RagA family outer membrane protein